ncbi:hypothetical protein OUZ56_007989 [Daphnia magna]|uniref:Uncharacterized protein n=1 Tax=Daphnia magna TaxID=35525 RepID=A0ABR0ABX6_9CRUS|nr:hypothetical protein OUZ56_007989 [Daphnia magna]
MKRLNDRQEECKVVQDDGSKITTKHSGGGMNCRGKERSHSVTISNDFTHDDDVLSKTVYHLPNRQEKPQWTAEGQIASEQSEQHLKTMEKECRRPQSRLTMQMGSWTHSPMRHETRSTGPASQ